MATGTPSRFQRLRTQVSQNKWLSLNTLFLVAALVVAIVALVYALHNKKDIDDLEHKGAAGGGVKSNFTNSHAQQNTHNSNNYSNYSGNNDNIAYQRTDNSGNNFWGPLNKVLDGADAGNSMMGGAAQSQCPPIAIAEPFHPTLSSSSGAPRMVSSASAHISSYPDETASQSLAGKTTYSCAPDVASPGGSCDYAINPDNLMPGNWREGVGCSDGTDPNSQWAKYSPTRSAYYRYITAAGSARLGVITRSSMRKVLGVQNFLRSSTSTPITAAEITPFNGSSHRAEAIFRSVGSYPVEGSNSC